MPSGPAWSQKLRDEIGKAVIGQDAVVERLLVALLTNLALFLVFSFIQIARSPAPAAAWPRLIADLVCSQVFLALIAPWFFALQHRALALTGTTRELTP